VRFLEHEQEGIDHGYSQTELSPATGVKETLSKSELMISINFPSIYKVGNRVVIPGFDLLPSVINHNIKGTPPLIIIFSISFSYVIMTGQEIFWFWPRSTPFDFEKMKTRCK
jgi:hypothetical protein